MRYLILTIFMLLAIPLPVAAQDAENAGSSPPVLPTLGITQDDARPLRQTNTPRTLNSISGQQIYLSNGDVVDLVGIWIPQGQGYDSSDESVNAKAFLDKLFSKQSERDLILYQTPVSGRGRITRLGHELAHVVRKAGNIWIQGALIANGLAQAWPTPSNPELADKMYALEKNAREEGKGLWAKDSPYRLVEAGEDIPNLDRFAVVEGTIESIAMVSNVLYLNFGKDYKNDFTIGIKSPVRQVLARNNVDPMKLQNQRVRVRGWIRYYNGPYIDLEDAILLETLDNPQQNNIVPGIPHLSINKRKAPSAPVINNAVKEENK